MSEKNTFFSVSYPFSFRNENIYLKKTVLSKLRAVLNPPLKDSLDFNLHYFVLGNPVIPKLLKPGTQNCKNLELIRKAKCWYQKITKTIDLQ